MNRPLAFVVALFAASTAFRAAEPRTEAFAVGVLRRDGALVPFAAFDGRRWAVTWTAPSVELQIPINLSSVPKSWWGPTPPLGEWQVRPFTADDGVPARTVRVVQIDWVQSFCLRQVALRTDYRSPAPVPPPETQPFPKDGLAIAPPRPLEPIEQLASDSGEMGALSAAVAAAFNKAERELEGRFGHPVDRERREREPPGIETAFAFGAGPRYYYVESVRAYRGMESTRGPECSLAFGTGWFVRDAAGAVKRLDMAVDVIPCSRRGATYMLPFGVVRAGGRAYWVAQYSRWNHERYMVIELKKDTVQAIAGVFGGGC